MITEGKRNILKVREWDENGAILEDQEQDSIFLPNQYMTRAVETGEELEVFVFIDGPKTSEILKKQENFQF